MLSTIVVSPRERFSSIIASLESLFATVPADQPVIVIEGATPADIRTELAALRAERPFEHIALPYPVIPNVARNMGAKRAQTRYVVLCDNDMAYQPGWLDALERAAERERADAVAPLIFIGPNDPPMIHHAGGWIVTKDRDAGLTVTERHRLMNRLWPDVADTLEDQAPVENHVCEFHCMMVRRDFLDQIGGLDERLVTREQQDFALQARAANGRVVFAKDAHVTYMARAPFTRLDDLHYGLFRWSDANVARSLDAFEDSWSVNAERKRVRHGFTPRHRGRMVASYHSGIARVLGPKYTGRWLRRFEERRSKARFAALLRDAPPLQAPAKITAPVATLFPATDDGRPA